MSIYATQFIFSIENADRQMVEIIVQGVPGHIGHPSDYEVDHCESYLPKLPADKDPEDSLRAVVFVQDGYSEKDRQRYIEPLLTISGEEYENMSFKEILTRISHNLRPSKDSINQKILKFFFNNNYMSSTQAIYSFLNIKKEEAEYALEQLVGKGILKKNGNNFGLEDFLA